MMMRAGRASLCLGLLTLVTACSRQNNALFVGPGDDLAQGTPADLAENDLAVRDLTSLSDQSVLAPDFSPPPDLARCAVSAFLGCSGSDAIYCNPSGDGQVAVACGSGGCLGSGGCGQCTPGPASCDAANLVRCDAFGRHTTTACPLACSTTNGAHCRSLVPSNGWALDCTTPTGTLDLVLAYTARVNTDSGDGVLNFVNGMLIPVPPGVYDPATFTFHLKSLHILDGAALSGLGTHPLVLLVDGDVQIDGVLDVAAHTIIGGYPYYFLGAGATSGMGDGSPGRALSQTAPKGAGAGGGSYATAGGTGAGGTAAFGPPGSLYPAVADPTRIVPLLGGAHGGNSPFSSDPSAYGAPGGGAVRIVSCGTITVGSTGLVNAGGAGAQLDYSPDGGGGGGSGGAILLEAPAIHVSGVLAAAGGSGGGGGVGGLTNAGGARGWDAPTDTQCITTGGAGASGNGSLGGQGGLGACGNNPATDGTLGVLGTDPVAHGGGGGGGGRIRLNAMSPPVVGPDSITPSLPACYSTGALDVQ